MCDREEPNKAPLFKVLSVSIIKDSPANSYLPNICFSIPKRIASLHFEVPNHTLPLLLSSIKAYKPQLPNASLGPIVKFLPYCASVKKNVVHFLLLICLS